ncbi:hypothetical protein BN1095_6840001 [Clostridioides difficile]|uniref:Uncharacterized protein n=1 Tax=Clostridioides difficile TaxID=1496 RepID=A0A069AUX2_CLODI|nr:hypothetical protein BN1095_6840001 [Clostridioides difficile]
MFKSDSTTESILLQTALGGKTVFFSSVSSDHPPAPWKSSGINTTI